MSKQIPLQRIKWIDLTKGVAIFLMVCGHTGIPSLISNWIWVFPYAVILHHFRNAILPN